MKRSRPLESNPLEHMEGALSIAAECLRQARKCAKQIARQEQRQANAHHRPCRTKKRRPARKGGMQTIMAEPGHEPDPAPPIGERWVHIGRGTFIPLHVYKQHRKEIERAMEDGSWNQ